MGSRSFIIRPSAKSVLSKRVTGGSFNKTDFALGLMMKDTKKWNVPKYVEDGLVWLKTQLSFIHDSQEKTTVHAKAEPVIVDLKIKIPNEPASK